jgi:hypothetical protein
MRIYFLIVFLLGIFSGCSAVDVYQPNNTIPEIPTSTDQVRENSEAQPSLASSITPDSNQLSTNCVDILDNLAETIESPGVLVVKHGLINFETGMEVTTNLDLELIMPNGDILAAYSSQDGLILLNSSGEIISTDPGILEDSFRPIYWVDSRNLVLTTYTDEKSVPHPSLIYNIDSGEKIEIHPDRFPDFEPWVESIGVLWGSYGHNSRISISPNQHYAVYATYDVDNLTHYLVLWDLENDQEVARIEANQESSFPWWSPDGNYFLTDMKWRSAVGESASEIPSGTELVRINTLGEVERLTYLTTNWYAVEKDYVWSPDGTKIAFSLYLFENQEDVSKWWKQEYVPQLAVLDLETSDITHYCLPVYGRPIWSEDGKFIALGGKPSDEPTALDTDRVYVISLDQNIAMEISDVNNSPKGWMEYNLEAELDILTPTSLP